MRAVWFIDGRTVLHVGPLGFWPMMGVSASLFVGRRDLREGNDARQTMTFGPARAGRCAEVLLSRSALARFQLESLILAQNERWRQA